MPVVPRTNASKISAATIDQALAASADSESPEKPARADSEPREQRTTVDPSTVHETTSAADLISLPRTMSEEWMATDANDGAYEVSSRRPRWIVQALIAGLAAVGVVVVFALGGHRASSPAAEPRAVVQADAAVPVVVVAAVPADAAEVVRADAMVPLDAPQVAVVPVVADAGAPVASVPLDAAVPAKAVPIKPTTPKPPPPPQDERTIEQLVDASEFAKANTACAANTMFSTPRLVACATAACNVHSAPLAARWIRAIPRTSRDEIVAKCKSLGVEVAIP